jgi:hypothetical protein
MDASVAKMEMRAAETASSSSRRLPELAPARLKTTRGGDGDKTPDDGQYCFVASLCTVVVARQ